VRAKASVAQGIEQPSPKG